ncbi:MAG: DUF4314 domain-containing protein [Tepidanaerobacteraceae bacterium]|jgi:hypothetical protein|uniref:DUF4314 domain-containing protein n=1 Tax=Heliomicrobium modesticaldum TaxID=35701 RepID=UPI0006740636|nr:DUF4314 domain-containing protein [Heliomicrobium modesticaldum]MCR4431589.1 DUF4314 domain-containing protein [Tepidanaerobacteraceae bacterium]
MNMDHRRIQRIKDQYPPGTRIELVSMSGEADMPRGLQGTVDCVDDIGQLQMTWDNGRSLALVPGEDSFRVITQPDQGIKMKYELCAADKNEAALFFSSNSDDDIQRGCIGHFRCDFGHKGKEFWHTWFDHLAELITPAFKEDFQTVIDELRRCGPLENLNAMAKWCHDHEDARFTDQYCSNSYGFKLETEAYSYYIRCFPQQGNYNAYIYCYDRQQIAESMKQTEQEQGGMQLEQGM